MKFLNVGVLELLFILLLAFIVLGPKKAIKSAGDVGRWMRDATRSQFWKELVATSREIQDLPRKVMDEVEIQKVLDDLDRSTREVNALSDDFDSMDNAEVKAEDPQNDHSHQISPFSDESEEI
jgi:Sec-independent protein translocase protein TatA